MMAVGNMGARVLAAGVLRRFVEVSLGRMSIFEG